MRCMAPIELQILASSASRFAAEDASDAGILKWVRTRKYLIEFDDIPSESGQRLLYTLEYIKWPNQDLPSSSNM